MDRDSSSKTVEDCVKASAAADSSFNFEGALGGGCTMLEGNRYNSVEKYLRL